MDLRTHGLSNLGPVHAHLAPTLLIEMALARHEGVLAGNGAFVAYTAPYTGRAAKDKYIVRRPTNDAEVAWGTVNQPMEPARFERLWDSARTYFQGRELFVCDGWACRGPGLSHRHPRHHRKRPGMHFSPHACCARPDPAELAQFKPDVLMLHASGMHFDAARDQTRSDIGVILDDESGQRVLIAGTAYAGEIKKSVFTYLNYLAPSRNVFPMHCSATVGSAGDTALLFGLSGTGKTTLSADPDRKLIGDDEHGWSPAGIFNFEGGCYAKCIRLSRSGEPQIWDAIRFGSILENVVLDENTRLPKYDDDSLTENTRAAYPLEFIANIEPTSQAGHPRHLLFLTCDAFGVLPPVSKLTPAQAQYHFLSGYTAKIGGTEAGIKEPTATFSSCFGAPFLPRHPVHYARMLAERIQRHNSQIWLVVNAPAGPAGPTASGQRLPTRPYPPARPRPSSAMNSAVSPSPPIPSSACWSRHRVPTSPRSSCSRAAPGPAAKPTTPRRAASRNCSAKISRTSRRKPATR